MVQGGQQLTNPGVEILFGRIVGDRLNDADSQPVFGAIEVENVFSGRTGLFLLPLKQFFHLWMFDDRDSLVVIKKPLNHVGK